MSGNFDEEQVDLELQKQVADRLQRQIIEAKKDLEVFQERLNRLKLYKRRRSDILKGNLAVAKLKLKRTLHDSTLKLQEFRKRRDKHYEISQNIIKTAIADVQKRRQQTIQELNRVQIILGKSKGPLLYRNLDTNSYLQLAILSESTLENRISTTQQSADYQEEVQDTMVANSQIRMFTENVQDLLSGRWDRVHEIEGKMKEISINLKAFVNQLIRRTLSSSKCEGDWKSFRNSLRGSLLSSISFSPITHLRVPLKEMLQSEISFDNYPLNSLSEQSILEEEYNRLAILESSLLRESRQKIFDASMVIMENDPQQDKSKSNGIKFWLKKLCCAFAK